jgi:hypothetical protein
MRNIRSIFLLLVLVVVAIGCAQRVAVQKNWVPIDGSRADATLRLSYTYDPRTEMPSVSEQQAQEAAKARCNSWGYTEAEAFGGIMRNCNSPFYNPWSGRMDCAEMIVTKTYQCIGRGDAATPTDKRS